MPIIVGILIFMSGKNNILSLPEPEISPISRYFYTSEHLKFHAQLSWARKKFYNLGTSFLAEYDRIKFPSPSEGCWSALDNKQTVICKMCIGFDIMLETMNYKLKGTFFSRSSI